MATEAEKKAAEEAAAKEAADKKAAEEAAKSVKVKFLKSHTLYNKDETATFPAKKADWMIAKKIAVKA